MRRNLIISLLTKDLVRHNVIFFLGTALISILNYGYYPVLSRIVTVGEFGEIQAIIAIFTQIAAFITAYGYAVTHIVTNTNDATKRLDRISQIERFVMVISVVLFIILSISVISAGEKTNLDVASIIAVGLLVVLNVPLTSRQFILQGEKKLRAVSVGGVLFAFGKLTLTVALVYLMTNNILAAVVSYIVALLFALWYFQRKTTAYSSLKNLLNASSYKLTSFARSELRYVLFITVMLFCVTALYMSDTVLARVYFDQYTQGLYSGISSVARIVFFVTASVSGVLLTHITLQGARRDNLQTLGYSVLMVLILGGGIAGFFSFFSTFSIKILMSGEYVQVSHWLPQLSIMMILVAIVNTLAVYQIALRRYSAVIPMLCCLSIVLAGTALFHQTITHFVTVYIIAGLVGCVLLSIQIMTGKNNGQKATDINSYS